MGVLGLLIWRQTTINNDYEPPTPITSNSMCRISILTSLIPSDTSIRLCLPSAYCLSVGYCRLPDWGKPRTSQLQPLELQTHEKVSEMYVVYSNQTEDDNLTEREAWWLSRWWPQSRPGSTLFAVVVGQGLLLKPCMYVRIAHTEWVCTSIHSSLKGKKELTQSLMT